MLKFLSFLLILSLLASCGSNDQTGKKPAANPEAGAAQPDSADEARCALDFINGYVTNCNKMSAAVGMVEWVNASGLATEDFKKELEKISKEEELDADPIVDGQDYPDAGYVIESMDEASGRVELHGKNWPEFRLTMFMVKQNGKWLVDGCGIVNIPAEKRTER